MALPNAFYRSQNTVIRRQLTEAIGRQFLMLNLSDLDGSWNAYWPKATDSVATAAELARLRSLDYFRIWLYDEVGEVLAEHYLSSTVAVDLNDVAAMLRLKGPIEIKRLIEAGWQPEQAWMSALRLTANVSRGYVHAIGQRNLVGLMGEHSHVLQGWRRIIAPTACTFCRKLERVVYHPSAQWEKPHDGCGCTAEPVAHDVRVVKYLSPVEKARNVDLSQRIARRLRREAAELAALSVAA